MTESSASANGEKQTSWWVYIILADDRSLYTGITTDLSRRFKQHQQGKGARYFRARKPVDIVWQESHSDRASASRREAAIKRMARSEKLSLIAEEFMSH